MSGQLFCGLGGGLDVLNALPLYFGAQAQGHAVRLGSIRPAAASAWRPCDLFEDSGGWVTSESIVREPGRYAEPKLAACIGAPVAYFARRYKGQTDIPRLVKALRTFLDRNAVSRAYFVDGGGDSLILHPSDACADSEHADPFAGGDAEALEALEQIPEAILAVVAYGLDVRPEAFLANVTELEKRGGYFGRLHLPSGVWDQFGDAHLFVGGRPALDPYEEVARNVLVLDEEHIGQPGRWVSHTGTVTYHAMRADFGSHRTFVRWEPTLADGSKGVEVQPYHQYVYFFDPRAVQTLKRERNHR
jgi:hypothetical protein